MKTLHTLSIAFALAALLLAAGCSSKAKHDAHVPSSGPLLPAQDAGIENTAKFVVMDTAVFNSVTHAGLQERITADGRLEVVANIKNREGRRIQVQVSAVFKDAQHFSTGDETPWQTLILGENETQAVRFTSMNNLAKNYTIRVRQAR